MSLAQSEFLVQVGEAPQVPPQMLPAPQSPFEVQVFALHFAPVHLPPEAPQSAPTTHDAGGVQVAPLQVTPEGQSLSPLQVDLSHFAPLHVRLTPHAASPAQVLVVHLAPVQRALDVQLVST
jgi:hypothetical protein